VNIILASPTYGPVDPMAARCLRVAIMVAARYHTLIGDISPDRMEYSAARNTVLKNSIRAGADGVVWVDSDIMPPANGITKLLVHNRDFVSGVYFQRVAPHFPMFGKLLDKSDNFSWATEWPANTIAPMDGCGFGFVYTSTRLLRALANKFDKPFEYGANSEDLTFCRRAKECGFQLYVDTGIMCKHQGDAVQIGPEHFTMRAVKVADTR
jgi:hypothetical protein